MKKKGYYSSGEFARKAHITLRTLRYYDKHNILKPSFLTESGARFYSDSDFVQLQQILLLKYLGFSLEDIHQITVNDTDFHYLTNTLNLQLKLVRDKIEQMQLVEKAILDTSNAIKTNHHIDWNNMLHLIHLTGMEKSMKTQYQNASNISSRIRLHQLYSQNKQGWFPWIFEQCHLCPHMEVLELGCGDGSFWSNSLAKVPKDIHITLSDISKGMLRDAQRTIGAGDSRFAFQNFNCQEIPYADNHFDLILANHVLFYCSDISAACQEIKRVLKPDGMFLCSTYGHNHMKEISQLVNEFDDRIILAAQNLYEKFGLENGMEILQQHFCNIMQKDYPDHLLVPEAEPLIAYILSCHGNQNQYIIDHYKEFHSFVQKKTTREGFYITKEAGIFICDKNFSKK